MAKLMWILFIGMPILELAVIIQVGQGIGVLGTVLVMLLTAVLGLRLLKQQGSLTLGSIRQKMAQGELATGTLLEGVLLAVAGVLLITPGFVTDGVGFLLTFPISRKWCADYLLRMNWIQMQQPQAAHGFAYRQSHRAQPKHSDAIEGEFLRKD